MTTRNKIRVASAVACVFLAYAYWIGGQNDEKEDAIFSGSSSDDVSFRLFDSASGLPVARATMPSGWILGGKSTWLSNGQVREHFCYVFAHSTDNRFSMFLNPTAMFNPISARCASIQDRQSVDSPYFRDPTYFARYLADSIAQTYGFEEVNIEEATFEPCEVPADKLAAWRNPSKHFYARLHILYTVPCRCGNGTERVPFRYILWESNWFVPDSGQGFLTACMDNPATVCYSDLADAEDALKCLRRFVKGFYYCPEFVQYANRITTQGVQQFNARQNEQHEANMRRMLAESDRQDARVDEFCDYIKDVQRVTGPDGKIYAVDDRYDTTLMSSDGAAIQFNRSEMPPDFDWSQGLQIGGHTFTVAPALDVKR